MKLSADRQSTKIVKRFLEKTNMITIPCQFEGFGDCMVRFVSVSDTDKWNYKTSSYARLINFEVIVKKSGFRYSEDRIPTKRTWNHDQRLQFFKSRMYMAKMHLNRMIEKSNIPLFFRMAQIPGQPFTNELVGKVTFKYID